MKVICCTYYNNTASLAYNWLAFQIWNTPVWKLNEHHKLKKLVYMHYPPIYHTWLCCIANVPSLHVKKESMEWLLVDNHEVFPVNIVITCSYIPSIFTLNKTSTVIGWFLVTCPWYIFPLMLNKFEVSFIRIALITCLKHQLKCHVCPPLIGTRQHPHNLEAIYLSCSVYNEAPHIPWW